MADEVVELNVGGRLFATSRATLEKIPRLALDKQPRDSKERVFIGLSAPIVRPDSAAQLQPISIPLNHWPRSILCRP